MTYRPIVLSAFVLPAVLGWLTIHAASANSPPFIAALESQTARVGSLLEVRVIPGDADGLVPGLRLLNPPAGSSFNDNLDGTRTFSWIPGSEDRGVHVLTLEAFDASDSTLTDTRQLTINVLSETDSDDNLAPIITAIQDQRIALGADFDFRVVPVDPEGIVPALYVDPLPPGASFTDNRDGTRQFRWRPGAQGPGTVNLVFITTDAHDPYLSSQLLLKLEVTDANGRLLPGVLSSRTASKTDNRPPIFSPLEDQKVALGESFEFDIRPIDIDGTVPGLSIDRLPPGATFTDNLDGSRRFRWRPLPIDLGDTLVSFQAIDAIDPALRTQKSILLSVFRDPDNPVNFDPYINGIQNPMIRAGDTLNLVVQPVDPDFTVPSLTVHNAPAGSEFVDNLDGSRTLIWPTDINDTGVTTVSFLAVDADDPGATASSSVTIDVVDRTLLQRPGERLRNLAAQRNINIGFAAILNADKLADNQLYLDTAAEEFDIVTPENSHKMGWIHPQRGLFRFEDADRLADYAEANGMLLHGHPLVWFAQLPGWVQVLDPLDAEAVMMEHIEAVAGRYRSRVAVWDVVNEALEDDGRLRDSIWYRGMGEAHIRKAFAATRAIDPTAQLIYNDYDVAWENPKSDAMHALLQRELAAGTPIDGVGFQMHLRSGFDDFTGMERNLQRFADLGLDIYITEFDVAVDAPDTEQVQAEVYRRVLEICLAQTRCKAIQTWGYTDRYSWRSDRTPLLLDHRYQPKAAYRAWQKTLEEF